MSQRANGFRILLIGGLLAGLLQWSPSLKAADGGPSALPRREDLNYRMPGIDPPTTTTLSWQLKRGPLPAYSDWYDSLTPSVFLGGPVYYGITWFWKETGLPGDIQFIGYATAAGDTVIYTQPILWLPLDPVATGTWSTIATNSAGEEYSFNFSYDGLDTVIAGAVANPETLSCWRIVLDQLPTAVTAPGSDGVLRDGMGIAWEQASFAKAAKTDTLWYEAAAFPRRRIALRSDQARDELIYLSHQTRDTPVASRQGGFGRLKTLWKP